jgi:hypothetical protein
MYSNVKSKQGNKAVQVFCTTNGWTPAFTIVKEKNAHEALLLMFQRDGVPNMMVMDGAKEKVEGDFRCKLCKDGCYIKYTEHRTQKSNSADASITELKQGVGRDMVRA